MMTGERIGVGHDPQRGAAYVRGWIEVLEKDPHEIHRAARDAQKMSDYLVDRAIEREVEAPVKEKTAAELGPAILSRSRVRKSATPPNNPLSSPRNNNSETWGQSR